MEGKDLLIYYSLEADQQQLGKIKGGGTNKTNRREGSKSTTWGVIKRHYQVEKLSWGEQKCTLSGGLSLLQYELYFEIS